jgi:DNA polymerase (family X)
MDKHAVALVLDEIATLLDATGESRFKARAFQRAARAVDKTDADLRTLIADGTLYELAGIGPATGRVVEELVIAGESRYHQQLRERAPSGLRALLRVPGLGPKKIVTLHEELGIRDLDDLEAAARSGRIASLKGFGAATQQRVLDGLAFARSTSGRRRLHQAEEAADRLAGFVASLPGVTRAIVAGDLRRGLEIVDGITIVAIVGADATPVAQKLRATSGLTWFDGADDVVRGRFGDALPVEVVLTAPDRAGITLLHATGPAAHVRALQPIATEKGVDLEFGRDAAGSDRARSGADRPLPDEESVYAALEMQWVPPELREGGAEIALAVQHRLPRLVELTDLRGCFHCHTTYSDGVATLQEMAEGALALGWHYLGIADHSRNAGYAGGLTPQVIRRQQREIQRWNRDRGDELWLFSGVEADILQDGQLDYAAQGEDDVLDSFDYVVASVHSHFRMDRETMTRRILRALSDPRLTMLGHATGRLLLNREGYPLDIDAVLTAAARAGAAVEINADPHRLDLGWEHWARGRKLGVRCAINPDAHSVAGMRNVRYGVVMARRGGLTAADVINTWSKEDVVAFMSSRKVRGTQN